MSGFGGNNIFSQNNNSLSVSNTNDFAIDISRGLVSGYKAVSVIGRNSDIDTTGSRSFPADIWPAPNDITTYPFPSSAVNLEVLSSSNSDIISGIGAQTILVSGLDNTFSEYSTDEVVFLNGTTPVALTRQYLRINRFVALTAGSSQSNIGNLILRMNGGGDILGYIPASLGVNQTSIYSVPVNNSIQVQKIILALNRTTSGWAEVCLKIRFTSISGPWLTFACLTVNSNNTVVTYDASKFVDSIPGGSDIKLTCEDVSNNNMNLTAFMGILQYPT